MERVEHELVIRGARVEKTRATSLKFLMPRPWNAPGPNWIMAANTGDVAVGAGGGGPWRVNYGLHFPALRITCFVITIALAVYGWGWSRDRLFLVMLAFWAIAYGIPYLGAWIRFKQILRVAASEVVERRHGQRAAPDTEEQSQ